MSDDSKIGFTSEIDLLRIENRKLKLELEKTKYKIMEDDVENKLNLYHYFIQHWDRNKFLGLVADGKFLRLFSEAFNVETCQIIIDKYSYDDLVKVVRNFYKELTAKTVLKQEQEKEEDENE